MTHSEPPDWPGWLSGSATFHRNGKRSIYSQRGSPNREFEQAAAITPRQSTEVSEKKKKKKMWDITFCDLINTSGRLYDIFHPLFSYVFLYYFGFIFIEGGPGFERNPTREKRRERPRRPRDE